MRIDLNVVIDERYKAFFTQGRQEMKQLSRLILTLISIITIDIQAQYFDKSRFEKTVLLSGMPQPMEMEIGPDNKLYFIELIGKLRRIDLTTGEHTQLAEIHVTTSRFLGVCVFFLTRI